MKKLLLIFAIAMLASCSNKSKEIDGSISTLSFDGEVSFSTSMLPDSKVVDDVFESGDQIVVTAFYGESTYSSQAAYIYSGTIFMSTKPIKLIDEEHELSYIAAYPAVSDFANDFEFTVLSDQSAGDNFEISDLLLASAEATNSLSPKLTFAHALSNLIINFEGDDLAGGTLTIYAKATTIVDMAADSYTAIGDAVALTPAANSSSKYSVIFAPQDLAAGDIVATYELGDRTYTWTATNTLTFASGIRSIYTWTIDTSIEDPTYNGDVNYTENIDDDEDDDASATLYLSELSATTYPEEDTWIILDETASTTDFAGFNAAIEHISTNDTLRCISVEFPNIEAIPECAIFGNSSVNLSFASGALYSVSAEKATSIGSSAFTGCTSLTTVDMPSVTAIGFCAFWNCESLTTVEMPLLTTIGGRAFWNCESLTTVDMPSVTTLGSSAFNGCTALTTVDMPLVTSIEKGAFAGCSSLTTINVDQDYYTFKDSILYDRQMENILFVSNNAFVNGLLSLPESVISINSHAFYDCTSLISVYAPSVTTIGSTAFYRCTALTTVDMPSVTTIEYNAFSHCTALTTIDMPLVTSIGSEAFWNCCALTTIDMPLVTTIGSGAFISCTALTTININNAYYTFKDGILYDDTQMSSARFVCDYLIVDGALSLPESIISISDYAFYGNNSLISVYAPSATYIGSYAFEFCSALTTVDMPLVTTIGSRAFYVCTALTTVDMPLVTSIGSSAFHCCNALTTVDMPSVTTIVDYAFQYCTALTTVDMPLVTDIGDQAFYGCTALTTLKLATGDGVVLSSVDSDAFKNVTTTDIDLTVGAANASLVSGNVLTVGSVSFEFKSITVL